MDTRPLAPRAQDRRGVTMNDTERVRITLECHHLREFEVSPPMLGELIYCVSCQDMRRVTDAPPEWRIRCTRCPYSRRMGTARLNAEVRAAQHRQRTGHPVQILNGRKLVYIMGRHNPQQSAQGVAGKYADEDTPF